MRAIWVGLAMMVATAGAFGATAAPMPEKKTRDPNVFGVGNAAFDALHPIRCRMWSGELVREIEVTNAWTGMDEEWTVGKAELAGAGIGFFNDRGTTWTLARQRRTVVEDIDDAARDVFARYVGAISKGDRAVAGQLRQAMGSLAAYRMEAAIRLGAAEEEAAKDLFGEWGKIPGLREAPRPGRLGAAEKPGKADMLNQIREEWRKPGCPEFDLASLGATERAAKIRAEVMIEGAGPEARPVVEKAYRQGLASVSANEAAKALKDAKGVDARELTAIVVAKGNGVAGGRALAKAEGAEERFEKEVATAGFKTRGAETLRRLGKPALAAEVEAK